MLNITERFSSAVFICDSLAHLSKREQFCAAMRLQHSADELYLRLGWGRLAGCVSMEAISMYFYFNNSSLIQDQLKQVAELYNSTSSLEGGDAAQSGAKVMARSQLEIWALANRRARAALSLPSQLSTCRSPQDFMSAYCNFWQSALTEYADTTKRVNQLIAPLPIEAEEEPSVSGSQETVKVIRTSRTTVQPSGVRPSYQEELRQAS